MSDSGISSFFGTELHMKYSRNDRNCWNDWYGISILPLKLLWKTDRAAARVAPAPYIPLLSSPDLGGVNHCRSHCRLAKFRGLRFRGEIQLCDWSENAFLYVPSMCFQAMGQSPPNPKPRNLMPEIPNLKPQTLNLKPSTLTPDPDPQAQTPKSLNPKPLKPKSLIPTPKP